MKMFHLNLELESELKSESEPEHILSDSSAIVIAAYKNE